MKRFTPLFIYCFIAFPFLQSCNYKAIKGNYTMVEKKISITDYDEIQLLLPAEVIYQQISQEEPFLQVQIDENLFSHLDISVQGKQLIIRQNSDSMLQPTRFKIYTNSKNLSKVQLFGSGDIQLSKAVNAQNMEIHVSGSGDVKTDSLYCENLQVQISGSGDVELKGAATYGDFSVSGSGDIKASNYLLQYLNCNVSGSGDIDAYVTEEIITSVAGSGAVHYTGEAKLIQKK